MTDDNPPERDVKDFEFQQLCKVRVTPAPGGIPNPRVQWLTSSSRYGLTFVASDNGFKVFKTEDFPRLAQDHAVDRLQHVVTDFPVLASVTVQGSVSHIALSCDDLTLGVATATSDLLFINVYDVRAFANQVTGNLAPFLSVRLNGSAGSTLLDLAWNPAIPSLLVTCLSDGRLDMFDITDKLGIKANIPGANARCVCWSPKGKQLVAGKEDGTLIQYDPDLREKKKWDYPTILSDDSYQALDVVWVSTYTFLVAYISKGADCSDQPQVILVNGGKDTAATYTGFDDVCYGTGEERQRKYFFNFISRWEMVLSGSSNASEVGIIGKHNDIKTAWEHWNLDDAARAECPLTEDYVDTYPMGLTVDFTSQIPIPKGESESYPPSPLLLVLTTDGLIIPYHMIYSHKDTPVITAPKEQLTAAGLRKPISQPLSNTGQPASQSGGLKLLGAGSSASSQSEAKPAFGAGLTPASSGANQSEAKPFSFAAPPSSGSQTKPFSFGGAGSSAATPFSFKPGANATSTPKPVVAADSSVPPTKLSAPPNVNLFKSADPSKAPTTADSGAFKFGQSSTGSAPKPFIFGTSTTSAPPGAPPSFTSTATSALSSFAPSATSALPSFMPSSPTTTKTPSFGSQPVATTAAGFGISTSTSQKPFSFTTLSAAPANTAAKSGTSAFTGLGTSDAKSGTASPLTFGSSTAQSAGTQKPTPTGFAQPVGSSSAASGVTKAPSGFGMSASASTMATSGFKSAEASKPRFSGMGTLGAGAAPPPPPYSATKKTETPGTSQPRAASPVQAQPSAVQAPPTAVQAPPTAVLAPPTAQDASVTASVDHSFSKSISEEIEHFQKELQDLKSRSSRSKIVVGEKEESYQLKRQTENIAEFWKDIRTTTKEQSREVQEQRSLCLDMFAMAEECRGREQLNSDPKYSHLLKMQALDPGSLDKLQQLQLQYQVLDQGVKDVDLILDTQWEEYQQRKKNRTNRVQRPTNDAIYRIVKSNQNIIHSQESKLRELEESLKQLKLVNQTSSWQPRPSTSIYDRQDEQTELSTLADSLVNPKARQQRQQPAVSTSVNHSLSSSNVNQSKLAKLRDHLYRRHVPVVKSTKPENLSMSRLLVPEELLQQRPERQQTQDSALKTQGNQAPPPSMSMSGNFVGMQRRSSPVFKQNTDNSSTGFNLNQPKESGFTLSQQTAPGFAISAAQSIPGTTTVESKVKVLNNFPASKLPTNSLLSNKPLTDPSVPKWTGSVAGTSMTGVLSVVTGEITLQEQPKILTNVVEINGQTFENITPEDSTENEEDYEEDDEYDEEESNGVGFGLEYLPAEVQAASVTSSTPVSTRISKSDSVQTPVSRKLFGGDAEQQPAAGSQPAAGAFKFGAGTDLPGTFSFGNLSAPDTTSTDTKKDAQASKPFVFTPLSTSSTKANSGFNFAMASGVKSDVEQKGVTGAPSGDTAAVMSSNRKEERKSPVGMESKPGGAVGFGFGEAAVKPKSISTDSLKTKIMTGLLESNSSSSVEDLAKDTAPPPTTTGDGAATGTESKTQSEVPDIVSSTSGAGDTGFKFAPSTATDAAESDTQTQDIQSAGDTVQPVAGTTPLAGSDEVSSSADQAPTTVTSAGLFGKTGSSTTGLFGKATTSSGALFGQPSTSGGVFGSSASAPSSGGLFGAPATTSGTGGLFGNAAATSSSGGLFGAATTSSSGGLFGAATTTSGDGGSFGVAATTASSGGLFGATSTTSSSGGLFGAAATTSSGGLFGSSAATSTTGGLFGSAATTSSSGGLFGAPTSASTSGGLFGSATTTAGSGGVFGSATSTTGSGGLFGATTTTAGSGGLFGSTSTTPSTGGLFGAATTTSSTGGLFGSGSTSGGLFGQPSTASSPFGKPAGDQSGTGTGLFGQRSSSATSAFGGQSTSTTTATGGFGAFGSSSGSGFGTATSGAGFGFGQSSPSTSGFGGFGQSPGFGQASSGDQGGGGMFSGLGGKPSAEKAGTNVFGAAATFGTPSSQESTGLFGSGGAKAFGSAATSSAGGSFTGSSGGAFSGGGTQGGSGFGSPPSFGSAPAFGGAPKFGSGSAFGGGASFGSGATFGSAPAFGNPGAGGGTFGSSSPASTGGFASFASGSSPTFGALAHSSDSPSFGGLNPQAGGDGGNVFGGGGGGGGFGSPSFGGQQQQQQNTGFGGSSPFGANPSFTGYRG